MNQKPQTARVQIVAPVAAMSAAIRTTARICSPSRVTHYSARFFGAERAEHLERPPSESLDLPQQRRRQLLTLKTEWVLVIPLALIEGEEDAPNQGMSIQQVRPEPDQGVPATG
jgi:hypothetical protein